MSAVYPTVLSGQQVSSAFTLSGATALGVQVPSGTTSTVFVEFATSPTADANSWHRLYRQDGSGLQFVVTSGPGFGVVPYPPTPYGRIAVGSGPTTTLSDTVVPIHRV